MNEVHERFGTTNPEIGGIVHLDHVNFETPDHEMATVFYLNGLGFTRDPYRRADEQNMGINVGLQQFHLPRRGQQTPPLSWCRWSGGPGHGRYQKTVRSPERAGEI